MMIFFVATTGASASQRVDLREEFVPEDLAVAAFVSPSISHCRAK